MGELPREVAVVGAGTMGAGITRVFAQAGCSVRLAARRAETLAAARQRLGPSGERVLTTTSVDEALSGADFVVETISEAVEPKRVLLERAEQLVAPEAILTTNTSSLRLSDLAGVLGRPQRFAGLHWFNPPELVPLVEVVAAADTAPDVLETLQAWMAGLGKAPIVLQRDVPGFVANRLQYALVREAYALVDGGVCSYTDVDRAITHGLGARWAAIGPFETMDLAGLDVHAAVAENLFPVLANGRELSPGLVATIDRGALGVKNGHGLLGDYDEHTAGCLTAWRDRVLRTLAALRADEEPA
jgi:3-hydroxybutyryl-CoA dehydrogenase